MLRRHILPSLAVIAAIFLALPVAHADVDTAPAPAADPIAAPDNGTPLLVIRFNQKRVYFDRALRQAITASERAKHGVNYDVVSYMPAGQNKTRTEDLEAQDGQNLNAVVQQMTSLGVEASRIHTNSMAAPDTMTSQEIQIFVK